MSTRVKFSFIFKLTVMAVLLICSVLKSFASVNALSGINITQLNDKYVNVSKILENDNNLTLILNSTIPADSVDIIYDNTSGIDNVIVQKKNNDNTVISIEGNNLSNASIITKDLSTGLVQKNDSSLNMFSSNFYIADFKLILYCVLGFALLFFMLLLNRPANKKYISANNQDFSQSATLRNKINSKSRYIPSINYNISKSNMSVPKELRISQIPSYQNDEQIRKAG